MIYVVSEYAKYKSDVVLNVECFQNEIIAKNYVYSRIEEFKRDFYVIDENVGEDYGYLANKHREYWIKLYKREMR